MGINFCKTGRPPQEHQTQYKLSINSHFFLYLFISSINHPIGPRGGITKGKTVISGKSLISLFPHIQIL